MRTWGLALLLSAAVPAAAETLPPGFASETVVSGLDRPTTVAFAPDGRLFLGLKDGRVRVAEGGALLPHDFCDLRESVNDFWDRGLLGLAVHPQFPATPWVYLLYVHDPPGTVADGSGGRVTRIVRVSARPGDPTRMLEGSEVVLAGTASTRANIGNESSSDVGAGEGCGTRGAYVEDCIPADSPSHDGGTLAYSPDGAALFATLGDGAHFSSADRRAIRALDLDSLAGKVLRLDPATGDGLPDNPFWNGAPRANRSRVYSLGLRNPFRMAVHPVTGEPFVGDVGWNAWEEIDTGRGANFGWPCYEGSSNGSARQSGYQFGAQTAAACQALYAQGADAVTPPLFAYAHGGSGASVQAGCFYSATRWPEPYRGALFFADYNRDFIRYLTIDEQGRATEHAFAEDLSPSGGPVQVLLGPDGELWYVIYDGAASHVKRLRWTPGNAPPLAVASASPTSGPAPLSVRFSSEGSTDPDGDPLAFAWDFGDGAVSTLESPEHLYPAPGEVTATLAVTDSWGASSQATVRVSVGNDPPVPEILEPAEGATFEAGAPLALSGRASDPQEPLQDAALAWDLRIRHEQHVHFDYARASGASAEAVGPDHGDEDHALLVCLTATDSQGSAATTCREVPPLRTSLTLDTDPPGGEILYADALRATPHQASPVAGSRRDLAAPEARPGLVFDAWSDGGPRVRSLAIGRSPLALTARYVPDCAPGDVTEDGAVGLADFVQLRRMLVGLVPADARASQCGDLHPGTTACASVPAAWCRDGDRSLSLGDAVVLRRLVAGVSALGCTPCAAEPPPAAGVAGDVAPDGEGDGLVTVADVVLALRAAVGLVSLDSEAARRGDVAPCGRENGLATALGDGRVDVADVALLLRAAVGLETLDWPLRELELRVASESPLAGVALRLAGWPASARVEELRGCGPAGGADAAPDGLAVTCEVEGAPTLLLRYRSPRELVVAGLAWTVEAVDDALRSAPASLSLGR